MDGSRRPRYISFQGTARTLGGPSAADAAPAAAAAPRVPEASPPSSAGAGGEYSVNEAEPATSVQFRFWDGRRILAKFNLHNTVGDVRRFLLTARPDLTPAFAMKSMGFPPTPITDEALTVKEAGLENSVVVVTK